MARRKQWGIGKCPSLVGEVPLGTGVMLDRWASQKPPDSLSNAETIFPGVACDATQERNRWPFRFRVSNLSQTPRRKGLVCDNLRARREALAQIWSPGEATGPNQRGLLLSFAFFLPHQALPHLQGGCITGSVIVLGFLFFKLKWENSRLISRAYLHCRCSFGNSLPAPWAVSERSFCSWKSR